MQFLRHWNKSLRIRVNFIVDILIYKSETSKLNEEAFLAQATHGRSNPLQCKGLSEAEVRRAGGR
jgi:hypothetical protein